ncbi:preprotein translocase subunit YajC [Nocardioides sp. zg-DK7169]|uniref:preprotein translocase subunit YajC n=1 Tax=Nocardioides sp. zg-DK7169 TaxID=2736600 RepID=UPI001553D303|nr:preprotein translocase subunit YajC [Nocardioides sp. zg-DK7169]NPC96882.1 preprotein translocase subunit YajC [Nocardioides sp. zg-DK7169]
MLELLPIVAVALLFWLLIIRPASRRQKELSRMQGSLTVGDEVMLTSGILGTVSEITDEHVSVLIADGVAINVVRGAIGSITRPAPREDDDAATGGSTEDGPGAI